MKNTDLFSCIGLWGAATLFCLPFLYPNHTLPIPAFYHEWLAATVGIFLLITLMGRAAWKAASLPTIAALPLALLGLIAIQNFLGLILHPDQALLASLYLILCVLLMLTTRSLVDIYGLRRVVTLLAIAMLIGALLNTLAAILQHWEIHTPLDPFIAMGDGSYIFGNLAQANHFADQQALALASAFFLFIKVPRYRPLWALFGIGVLIGLALSGSRTAWLYLLTLLTLAYLLYRHQRTISSRQLLGMAAVAIPAFFLIQFGLHGLGIATPTDRLLAKFSAGTSLSVRLDMWDHAARLFIQNPLLGVGYQNFAWANFLFTANSAQTIYPEGIVREQIVFHHVHNLPLQLLAEFGIGAGIALLAAGYWLIHSIRIGLDLERWWIWSLLSVMIIHSMLELPLWYLHFLAPFAVLAAMADAKPLPLRMRPGLGRFLGIVAILAGIVIAGVLLTTYRLVEKAFTYNSQQLSATELVEISTILNQARSTGIFVPQIEIYMSSIPFEDFAPERGHSILELNTRAMQKMPTYSLIYRQIVLLAHNHEEERASQLLAMTSKAYPYVMSDFARALNTLASTMPQAKTLATQASLLASSSPTSTAR